MKALFLKNLTMQTNDGIATQRTDYHLENKQSLNLTRKSRESSDLSGEYDTNIYTSTKMIYDEMIERQNTKPRIEQRNSLAEWRLIWKNININIERAKISERKFG
jgi:hypothetical protein